MISADSDRRKKIRIIKTPDILSDPSNWGSIAALCGSFLVFLFIFYAIIAMPSPYVPANPFPMDNATDINPNLNISWVGGNPSNRIIYTVANLFKNDINPQIIYYISIYKNSRLIYTGIETGDSKRVRIYHKPSIDFDQGVEYSWQIISENNFGRKSEGQRWNFTTKNSALINFKKFIEVDPRNFTYNDSKSYIKVDTNSSDESIIITYNLSEKGWVAICAPITSELHGTKGVMYNQIGGGNPNTVEVKLYYLDKNNTIYQLLRSDIKTTDNEWSILPRRILFDEFDRGWVNDTYMTLPLANRDQIRRIDIAFSNKPEYGDEYGSGWVVLSNFTGIIE